MHLHAVLLPDGSDPVDLWVADGRLTLDPQDAAESLPGGWALPGLVDAHAHLSIDTAGGGRDLGDPDLVESNYRAHLRGGVLLVRDVGAVPGAVLPDGDPEGPRLLRSGRYLAPAGRYVPGLYEGVEAGALVEAALVEVAAGAAWVKVIADFPPNFPRGRAEPNYDLETLTRLVEAAHAAGARVAAHVTGAALADVVAAGVAAPAAARRYLGLPGLEPGAPADLVCYPADPRDDPEVLASPSAVVVGGRRVT